MVRSKRFQIMAQALITSKTYGREPGIEWSRYWGFEPISGYRQTGDLWGDVAIEELFLSPDPGWDGVLPV